MTITITPTSDITTVNGVRGRVWQGEIEGGGKCLLLVANVSTADPVARKKLSDCLLETPEPVETSAAEIWAAFLRQTKSLN